MALKDRLKKVEQHLNRSAPVVYVCYDGEPDRDRVKAADLTILYDYGGEVVTGGS